MAGVVLRLKLALYRSQLRRPNAALGFAVQCLLAVGVSLWLFASLWQHDGLKGSGEPVLVAAFTVACAYWLLTALLAVAGGDLLPIPQLLTFPLTRRQLSLGLAAATLVGFAPWITFIALLGVVPGFTSTLLAALIAIAAVVLEVALCIVLSLLVRSLVAVAGVGRRGRDRAVLLSIVVGMVAWGAYLSAGRLLRAAMGLRPSPLLDWLAALPPGALGRAVARAGSGHTGEALLLVAYGAAGLVAAVAALEWALGREPRVGGGPARAIRRERAGLALLGPLPLRRAGRTLGVAAAELRQQRRDPRRISAYLFGIFLALVWSGPWVLQGGRASPYLAAVLCAVAPQAPATSQLSNDAEAAWTYAVAAGRARAELLGKQLAIAAVLVPLAVVVAVGLAIWSGLLWTLAPALACAFAACAVWLGLGGVLSVRFPNPAPRDARRSAGLRGVGGWLVFPAGIVLLAPIVGAVALTRAALGEDLPGALAALVYGLLVWWLGLRWAADRLDRQRPEIVAALRGSSETAPARRTLA